MEMGLGQMDEFLTANAPALNPVDQPQKRPAPTRKPAFFPCATAQYRIIRPRQMPLVTGTEPPLPL